MSDFWLGFTVSSAIFTGGALVAWWWRTRGRWINWPTRLVPPPKVGRWQVWGVDPAGGVLLGRYRVRWTAQVVMWALTKRRAFPYVYQGFEVRRVR